jgi:plasmid stabilization system protein ParE
VDWEVVWSEPALENLEAAVRSATHHSEATGESLRAAILDSVAMLARFPEIGPVYERDRSGRTREVACRQYRIFYRLAESERRVQILAVWHSSRREPRLPR